MQFDQQRTTQANKIRPRRSSDEAKSLSFRANVPFSWEKTPGTSKLKPSTTSDRRSLDHYFTTTTPSPKLIPPPARVSSQHSFSSSTASTPRRQSRQQGPCLCSNVDVHPSVVSTVRNSFRLTGASPTTSKNNPLHQDDPFLAAFIKCTQQMHNSKITNGKSYAADHINKHNAAAAGVSAGRKKNSIFSMFTGTFSCKYSCAVRDESVAVTMPRKSIRY